MGRILGFGMILLIIIILFIFLGYFDMAVISSIIELWASD